MPEFTMPEMHLPEIKLPEGLRDMNRHDIQSAISDRLPRKADLPDLRDLTDLVAATRQLPHLVDERLTAIEKAIEKIDLPKTVEARMPSRRRSSPIKPLAAILALGSIFTAVWYVLTSPTAGARVREMIAQGRGRLEALMDGRTTTMTRYDDDADLGSLLPDPAAARPSVDGEAWPDTTAEVAQTVGAGNGSTRKTRTPS